MPPHDQGITIVGLGPGTWDSLTLEAARTLEAASTVYVRTSTEPWLDSLRAHLPQVQFQFFDALYAGSTDVSEVYDGIAARLLELAEDSTSPVYAVPGSPTVAQTSVRLVLERFAARHVPVRIVQGISIIEPILAAVDVADASWVELLDATEIALLSSENGVGEIPGEEERMPWRSPVPTASMVVSTLQNQRIASGVKQWLGRYYPDNHDVYLVTVFGPEGTRARRLHLDELDRDGSIEPTAALFVPPLTETDNVRTFAGLMQLTRRLRAPGGCPWDREQSHASLKPHLLEETYEVLDALDRGDPLLIREELGDLLFQVTIHCQIASEAGTFTVEDVLEGVMRKLIGRHPHVFGDMKLDSAQDVRHAWESFKQREKPKRNSVMEEIPRGLPALPRSNLMQKRASSVGFEWPSLDDVLAKVDEELAELRTETGPGGSRDAQREEFGDILFALVSVARHLRIDPEEALRLANQKFERRFHHVESRTASTGKSLRALSAGELDAYWNEAKVSHTES